MKKRTFESHTIWLRKRHGGQELIKKWCQNCKKHKKVPKREDWCIDCSTPFYIKSYTHK